jgi:hypothetical protein
MTLRTVTIVAKGASAEHAPQWLADCDTDVATIHDAGRLIPDVAIRWCFVTHACAFEQIEPHAARIQQFLTPEQILILPDPDSPEHWAAAEVPEYARDRHGVFESSMSALWDNSEAALTYKIVSGFICHYTTVSGALHWLAKYGKYDKIRIIGVDAGIRYAGDLAPVNNACLRDVEADSEYFRKGRVVVERLADLVTRIYGVEIEWYGES